MGLPYGLFRNIPDLAFLLVVLTLHWAVYRRLDSGRQWGFWLALSASYATFSIATSTYPLVRLVSGTETIVWLRGVGQLYALATMGAAILWLSLHAMEARFVPQRRSVVKTLGSAVIAAPALLTGYGAIAGRIKFQVREVDLPVAGLVKTCKGCESSS